MSSDDTARHDACTDDDGVPGSLAGLIERLAKGTDRRDEAFVRRVATALHAQAAHVTLPEVEAMGLDDVMVTFTMDRDMRLMVTGSVGHSGGQGSIRWREADFPRIPVVLHHAPRPSPYLFATLDFSPRGRQATLTTDMPPHAAGAEVVIRCLATVGHEVSYRVIVDGQELSVTPETLSPVEP